MPPFGINHSRDGENAVQFGRWPRKKGTLLPARSITRDFFRTLTSPYPIHARVLKWHHPCLFDWLVFFADDGFRHGGEPFCPFRFSDTVFAPHDAFFALPQTGIHRSNKPARASSTGKHKRVKRTIGIEPGAATREPCLQTCKRRKHVIKGKYGWGFRIIDGSSSILKPEVASSGFFPKPMPQRWRLDKNHSAGIKKE